MASSSTISPQLLFKTAAVLNGLIAPGHVMMGFKAVYPALDKMKVTSQDERYGQRGSQSAWNWVTGSIIVSGGPRSFEETVSFFTMVGTSLVTGLRYVQIEDYVAGTLLSFTAGVSLAAYYMAAN